MQNKRIRLSSSVALCFCFLLLAALLSACGGSGAQASSDKPTPAPTPTMAPTPTPAPTTTYKGDTYTFNYNPSWALKKAGNTVALSSKTSSGGTLSIASAPTGGAKADITKGLDASLAIIKASGSNYQEDPSASKTTQVGGDTWQQKAATMDMDNNGTKVPVKVYVLADQHGQNLYMMDYIITKTDADNNMKQYIQPVLDSFKFLA